MKPKTELAITVDTGHTVDCTLTKTKKGRKVNIDVGCSLSTGKYLKGKATFDSTLSKRLSPAVVEHEDSVSCFPCSSLRKKKRVSYDLADKNLNSESSSFTAEDSSAEASEATPAHAPTAGALAKIQHGVEHYNSGYLVSPPLYTGRHLYESVECPGPLPSYADLGLLHTSTNSKAEHSYDYHNKLPSTHVWDPVVSYTMSQDHITGRS